MHLSKRQGFELPQKCCHAGRRLRVSSSWVGGRDLSATFSISALRCIFVDSRGLRFASLRVGVTDSCPPTTSREVSCIASSEINF